MPRPPLSRSSPRPPSQRGLRTGRDDPRRGGRRAAAVRLLCAALLGAGAAVLVSCGGSGAGLIPSEDAGPLVSDFQAVERAAANGNGDCGPTQAALSTTERDFQTLPASVD
ncbi:MAG TPA: hypothetical protein VNV37_06740, partial [Solirubrobacteraceae bacterium]|nr:hypothetical protein [Solirubrobacteraceae bacterium]